MIVQPDPQAPKHFYLLGTRAPLAGSGPQGVGERVAVLVARQVLAFDGSVLDGGEVLLEDQAFDPAWQSGPFRVEAEIAPYKPEADVVVVDAVAAMLPGGPFAPADQVETALLGAVFGNVAADRGAGFGMAQLLHFGWRPRGSGARLAEAGDAAGFDPDAQALPAEFKNRFFNGQPLAGQAPFEPGHRLHFTDTTGAVDVHTELLIPEPPLTLSVTQDGAALQPPALMVPRVDTVVMDRGAATFTLVWRAVLPWEDRYASATLRVH
jgi:hypothetical protein